MDIEEIDSWYEEEKERLTQEYRAKISKGHRPEKLRQGFITGLERTRRKYESMSQSRIAWDLRQFFLSFRISVLRDRILTPLIALKEKISKK